MNHAVEIDWIAAWYGAYAVWDTTINFWMTATFGVIVAVHALGSTVTTLLSRLIASLYAAFSLYTVARAISITEEGLYIIDQLQDLGIAFKPEYLGSSSFYSDLIIWAIIIFGSIVTIYFVLSAPKRSV